MAEQEDGDADADEEDGGGLGGALPGGAAERERAADVDGEQPEEGAQAPLPLENAEAVQAERRHAVAKRLPERVEESLGEREDHGRFLSFAWRSRMSVAKAAGSRRSRCCAS